MMKIRDTATLFTDGDWIESKDQAPNGIRLLQTGNIGMGDFIDKEGKEKYITEETFQRLNCTEVLPGDILISRLPDPVGRACVVPDLKTKMITAVDCTIYRVNDSKINKYYVNYFLMSGMYFRNLSLSINGATRKRISRKNLEKVGISIPSMETQQHVVNVLDRVRTLISLHRKEISFLDELVKARFAEMFGDPVRNEKGWEVKVLSDVGSCKNGMNFHNDETGVQIHCLGVGDFKDNSFITDTESLPLIALSETPAKEYLLENDDIVFVRSNGNKNLVGRSVLVYPNDIPVTFSGFCIRYRLKDACLNPQYLLQVLKADSIRNLMHGRGANIQNLNQKILLNVMVPIPPLDLQNQFVVFTHQVEKSKAAVQRSLEETQTLFDSLMQQYFG